MSEKLLTAEELADALQVSKRTVKYWLADGVIPAAIREGQILRFDLPAVKRALAKRAAKATPAAKASPDMVLTY
jgi:excisionase family DNA binding protein